MQHSNSKLLVKLDAEKPVGNRIKRAALDINYLVDMANNKEGKTNKQTNKQINNVEDLNVFLLL